MTKVTLLIITVFLLSCQEQQTGEHNTSTDTSNTHHAVDDSSSYECDSYEYIRSVPTINTSLGYSISEDTILIKSKKPEYKISGYYPQIIPPLPLNNFIRDTIETIVREWDKAGREDIFKKRPTITNSIYFDYEIEHVDSEIICIRFSTEFAYNKLFLSWFSLVYNYRTDRFYRFKDLFRPNSNYLDTLALHCKKEIREYLDEFEKQEFTSGTLAKWKLQELEQGDGTHEDTISYIEDWSFDDSTLYLTYYQSFFPAPGTSHWLSLIPIDSLQSIANPEGPLWRVIEARKHSK